MIDLKEAERRLRGWYRPAGGEEYERTELANIADAIHDHLSVCGKHEGCVSAEKVRALANRMRGSAWEGEVRALLPPEPSALEQAIAMVEQYKAWNRREAAYPNFDTILALLRRAKEER